MHILSHPPSSPESLPSSPSLPATGQHDSSLRPKRRQVKSACVNCRKACKKCEEQRPCCRCTRLGLQDSCIDYQRKPRVKGYKRGQYRTTSARCHEHDLVMIPASAAVFAPDICVNVVQDQQSRGPLKRDYPVAPQLDDWVETLHGSPLGDFDPVYPLTVAKSLGMSLYGGRAVTDASHESSSVDSLPEFPLFPQGHFPEFGAENIDMESWFFEDFDKTAHWSTATAS